MNLTIPNRTDVVRFEQRALLMLAGLEDGRRRRSDRAIILGVVAFLAGLLGWAALTRLPEIAIAMGQVAAEDPVALVQHLEGGTVEAVLVGEGDRVREGQALVRFVSAQAQGELDRLRARAAGLRFREAYLRALLDDSTLDLSTDDPGFSALAADQLAAHQDRTRHRDDRISVLRQAIAQRCAEVEALTAQLDGVRRQIALHGNELTLRESLLAQGLTTRIAVLETRRALLAATSKARDSRQC